MVIAVVATAAVTLASAVIASSTEDMMMDTHESRFFHDGPASAHAVSLIFEMKQLQISVASNER